MNTSILRRSKSETVFRSASPLSNETLLHYAPSVGAASAHADRSERYTYIPTLAVVDGLRKEGFMPFEVRQTKCRSLDRRDYTKHLLRLRHESMITAARDQEVPEIVLLNSHDGTSSYRLMGGVFRLVCENGMIAGNIHDDVCVRHSGNVVDEVIEGSYRVLDDLKEIGSRIADYKSTALTRGEQMAFANAALQLRWEEGKAPVLPEQIIAPQRYADRGTDLWTTFNVAQERLVKGGVRGRGATGRRMTTREVGGVTENVRLNRALWTLADQLAKLKQAA
jgi:hypothetical protein